MIFWELRVNQMITVDDLKGQEEGELNDATHIKPRQNDDWGWVRGVRQFNMILGERVV